MAESKGTMLAKSMQKHAGRAKEKILQNLGKVDRTADEIFDDHLNNFTRQQASANRLQKEFNNYIRCIRAAQIASKSLMDAVSEIYEPQWTGYDALQAQTSASESLWQDFAHKLGDQVLIPLNTYTGQFPEMKKKVEKRNRKLIDYDSQRHSFQSLQASANKRKDDVKLTKGREQLEEARRTYEILNTELHDELPALYDSRILFLVTNLQTLFATEQVFHNETAKIYAELEAIVDKLATDSQRGSNTLRKQAMNAIKSSSPVQSPVKQMNNTNNINSSSNNYQNQITTNGSSNVNSPTSSPSTSSPQQQQQEARLDSVSPTPETTTEVPKSTTTTPATATTAPPTTAASSEKASTTEPSYQNAAATIVVTTESPATMTSSEEAKQTINSPNANSSMTNDTEKPTTVSPNTSPIKSTTPISNVTSAKDEILNNVVTAAAAAAAVVAPAVAAAPSEDVSKPAAPATMKIAKATPAIPTKGQLNGNGNNNDTENGNGNGNASIEDNNKSLGNETVNGIRKKLVNKNPFEEEEEELIYEVPKDATTTDLPPGVLYRVKATYGYVKEDVDELSFEVGDTIRVIEYDDPEDQEEGWLMGQKEGTDEKGLFPANFTRPI